MVITPGSSLFVVWTQGRFDYVTEGSFALRRDVRHLFGIGTNASLPTTNVVAVKVSQRLGR